ncbi:MAG: phage minor head protein [Bacillus sp. (in: firmicutes)]
MIDDPWAEDIAALASQTSTEVFRFLKNQRDIYIDRLPDEVPTRILVGIRSLELCHNRLEIPSEEFEEWVRNYILYDSKGFQIDLKVIIAAALEDGVEIAGTATLEELEVDEPFNLRDPYILEWLEQRATRVPELIQNVSDEKVIKNLWRVVSAGNYSIDTAADSLRSEFGFSEQRARVIARTEIISAGRSGQYFADNQSGMVIGKQWKSAKQERTRPGHRGADGQIVAFDEPFQVRNSKGEVEELLFPGDTSLGASAGNVIQCRCWYKRILQGEEDLMKG